MSFQQSILPNSILLQNRPTNFIARITSLESDIQPKITMLWVTKSAVGKLFFLKNFYRFENELLICRTHCTIKISTLKFQRNSEDQVEILKVKLKFRLNSSNTKKRIKNCPLRRFQRRNFASPPIKFSGCIPATEVLLIEQQQQRHLKITLMLFFIFFLLFFFSPRRGKSTHPSYSSPSST